MAKAKSEPRRGTSVHLIRSSAKQISKHLHLLSGDMFVSLDFP